MADRPSNTDLAKIHIAKKDLAIADDDYRAMLQTRYRVKSAAKLTSRQAWDLISHFRALGWKSKTTGRVGSVRSDRSDRSVSKPAPDDPQSRKIRALWITLANTGAVHEPGKMALNKYCKRMVGVDALRFATPAMKSRLIEFLKEWQRRDLKTVFGAHLPDGIKPIPGEKGKAEKFWWVANEQLG